MPDLPTTALALQGGGVHGAYAWGVLDRLTEAGLVASRVCGVSSGALLGTMYVQGMVKGGPDGARREMRRLWERVISAHALSPLQRGPLETWLWGGEQASTLAWQGIEAAMRLFSPAQLNPFGHNPLRPIVTELFDPAAIRRPDAIPLTVAATDVETGSSVQWHNREITVDVLLASCCLPFVFHAIEIGRANYWDGGYSGNPPLAPLLATPAPDELLLIRAQPMRRRGTPATSAEILNRLNEIACQGVLEAELANVPPTIRRVEISADAALADLPISSKFNADSAFLGRLFDAGRAAARAAWPTGRSDVPVGRATAP